jgi:hypothetical protein
MAGYSGTNCSLYSGACDSSPCHNQGACNDFSNGSFACSCYDKFTGTFCEELSKVNDNTSSGMSVGVYAGGVAAFIIVLLIIVGVCIYKRRKRHRTLQVSTVKIISSTTNPLYTERNELDLPAVPDASSKNLYSNQQVEKQIPTEEPIYSTIKELS